MLKVNDSFITYSIDAMKKNTKIWGLKQAFTEMIFKAICLKMQWHLVADSAHHFCVLTETFVHTAVLRYSSNRTTNPAFGVNTKAGKIVYYN